MAAGDGQYSLETKRKAVAYFNENQVPKHVENLLNRMFKERPEDIFGYMSEFFGESAKPPSISQITSHEVLSSRGRSTAEINLYCTINGLSKLVTSLVIPLDVLPIINANPKTPDPKSKSPEPTKQQAKTATESQPSVAHTDSDVQMQAEHIKNLIIRITDTLAPHLIGVNPTDQKNIDEILLSLVEDVKPVSRPISAHENHEPTEKAPEKTPQESGKGSTTSKKAIAMGKKQSAVLDKKGVGNKESQLQIVPDMREEFTPTDYAVLGVSMATLMATSTLKSCSLYEVLVKLATGEEQSEYTMPIPVMTLLTSGKSATGKQNLIKEVLVLPKPGTKTSKGIQQLTEIFHSMGMILCQKYGTSAKCITDDGSYSPALDKPEQAIDYVLEAINGCGYKLGSDVDIILNCAASDFYDQDKQKYEIILNTFKTVDDVINMYSEFLDRYPGIIGIIDGVRSQDRDGWVKLNQRIGGRCFTTGYDLYRKNPSILSNGATDKLSSTIVLSIDQANTVTQLIDMITQVKDQDGLLMLDDGSVKDTGTLVVDLAVASGARFVKLGGPSHMEHVCKYRRLAQIEQHLAQRSHLVQQQPHVFPVQEEEVEDSKDNDSQSDAV